MLERQCTLRSEKREYNGKVLEFLKEHKTEESKRILAESEEVLSEFEKVFPSKIVRADPKERPFEVTEENMQKIFDVLNGMFFEGKLKNIPLKGMTVEEAKVPIFERILKGTLSSLEIRNLRGLNVRDVNPSESRIVPNSEFIYIQLLEDKKTSFGYILSTLMHEMIHNYDNHYGDALWLLFRKITTGFVYDDHETKVFRKYMKMANENGVLVKKIDDKSYEMSNEEAQRYLLNLPNGEVKMESNNDNEENFNSMRVIKLSNDVFRFFCP